MPLSAFPEDAEVVPGAQFYAQDMEGNPMPLTVVAVEGEEVTVDFNHPLAGKDLDFQVEVVKVREATPRNSCTATPTKGAERAGPRPSPGLL